MSGSIRLHRKHGLAPALLIWPLCGKPTNGLALLGASADKVMEEVQEATGKRNEGYKEYGHNEIPDSQPCDSCKGLLNNQGTILVGQDIGQSLLLTKEMVDGLVGRVADDKGRVLDFDAMRGKVITFPKAFWYTDGDNIRLRDPKEWTI
jgi:hypothetical protein